jgi:hypothetical protein
MTTDIQRQEKMRQVPISIFDLYGSIELARQLRVEREKFSVAGPHADSFSDVIGDTILGFYHTKDLPSLLQKEVGVSADAAQRIVADLAELLAPVLEREAFEADPKKAGLKALQYQFGQTAAGAPTLGVGTGPDIAIPTEPEPQDPATLHNVTPMRTMATDVNRVHGYGAFRQAPESEDKTVVRSAPQDDLLKSRPRLTNIPKVGE